MANLEIIEYSPRRPNVHGGQLHWENTTLKPCRRLPQIFWANGSGWIEANLWARELITSERQDPETVARAMSHLLGYANWLENENINWWDFPARESDRCLWKYRGALIQARDFGELKPSTISARMGTPIRFYRWISKNQLIVTEQPMWSERRVGIRLTDGFGFEHTLYVATTDLAIPNRRVAGAISLEDGLLPVTLAGMRAILELAAAEASQELSLKLQIGFQSGLRIGTVTDLKVQTLRNATIDPVAGWHRLAVGPAAKPPVATKHGVNGFVPIPHELLVHLIDYATSTRRLKRQALAAPEHRDLLFLTRSGKPYGGDGRRNVNVAMMRLCRAGRKAGLEVFNGFHFHRSRATFATELTKVALRYLPVEDAVNLVRECCMHKDIATTLQYVRFIETSAAKAEAADTFTRLFFGLVQGKREHRE